MPLGSASGNAGLATYCQSTNPPSLDVWMRSTIGGQQSERMTCDCETIAGVLNTIDTCCGTTNGSSGGMTAAASSSGSCGTTVFRAACPDPPAGQVEISATAMINTGGPTTVDNWACSSDNLDDMREAWERCCL